MQFRSLGLNVARPSAFFPGEPLRSWSLTRGRKRRIRATTPKVSSAAADVWSVKAQLQKGWTPLVVCLQHRRSAFLRWPACSRRFTATVWHPTAATLTPRVSPCSRSSWSAACCCSHAAERPKRWSWGRWVPSSWRSAADLILQPGSRWQHVRVRVCIPAPRGVQPRVCPAAGVCGGSGRVFVPLQPPGEQRNLRIKEGQRGSTHQGTNVASGQNRQFAAPCSASTPGSFHAGISTPLWT